MKNRLLLIVLLCFFHFIMSAQKKADNPVVTFEKLWSTFNDRYANFELKQVDWNDTYKKYRPQITQVSYLMVKFLILLKEKEESQ